MLISFRVLDQQPGATHAPTLGFWMANASELLHFLKSDRHITAFSLQVETDVMRMMIRLFTNPFPPQAQDLCWQTQCTLPSRKLSRLSKENSSWSCPAFSLNRWAIWHYVPAK